MLTPFLPPDLLSGVSPTDFDHWLATALKIAGVFAAFFIPISNYLNERRRVKKADKSDKKASELPVKPGTLPPMAANPPSANASSYPPDVSPIVKAYNDMQNEAIQRQALLKLAEVVEKLGDQIDGLATDINRYRHEIVELREMAQAAAIEAARVREALAAAENALPIVIGL